MSESTAKTSERTAGSGCVVNLPRSRPDFSENGAKFPEGGAISSTRADYLRDNGSNVSESGFTQPGNSERVSSPSPAAGE